MRPLLLATLLGLAGVAGAAGCSRSSSEATQGVQIGSIPAISVDELAARLARGECRAVDANTDATRRRLGVIPGAVLLSDYETFLWSELPADKSKGLVFYCANEHCGASDEAAARAITAGYTDVKLLPAGITGWAKAGQQTAKL
ncbi:MAG TPA: rhodanese-like domain-containing protein [Kofleriaceae bacterium]|nr:rhodanese-like domain-containing protein [Kofleriaceae bacterium]